MTPETRRGHHALARQRVHQTWPRAPQYVASPRRLAPPLDLSLYLQPSLDISNAVDTPIGPRKPCGRRHHRRPFAPVPPVHDVAPTPQTIPVLATTRASTPVTSPTRRTPYLALSRPLAPSPPSPAPLHHGHHAPL
jgi:hypothetical protein